jgi:hypothetical protein
MSDLSPLHDLGVMMTTLSQALLIRS